MLLDTDVIRRRRMELGLSQRAVARRLAVTSLTIARIESGDNHHALTLLQLHRLADVLATPLPGLFAQPSTATIDDDGVQVRELGALLHSADEPVARATLADLLDTTPTRIGQLLDQLTATLEPAGLQVHDGPGGVTLVPETTVRDPERLRGLLQAQHATHGLTSTDATILARAHAGTLDPARLGNADLVAVARLTNAGLLDDVHLTDDVVYSLGLDQAAS